MKGKGKLIKKESLVRNFKLTFINEKEKELFLILHQSKREIYEKLKISSDYNFSWHQGKKNYSFVNPQSLKRAIGNIQTCLDNGVKQLFFKNLCRELKISQITEEKINQKLEILWNQRGRIKGVNKEKQFLLWIKDLLKTLFLRHYRETTGGNQENQGEIKTILELIEQILYLDRIGSN